RGIVPALDAEALDGMQEVLLQESDDACRGVFDRQTERPRELALYGSVSEPLVECYRATRERTPAQPSPDELRIRHPGVITAQSVGGRPGTRTGAPRTNVQQAGGVDPRDGAAAGADSVDFDRRRREVIAVDDELVVHRHVAFGHDHHVAAGAA